MLILIGVDQKSAIVAWKVHVAKLVTQLAGIF